MTYNHYTNQIEVNERYSNAVEMDVRRCMKEACKAYRHETEAAILAHKRKKTAKKAFALAPYFLAAMALLCLSGCGLMGVRRFEAWDGGPEWDFAEGLDFSIGANAIDNVDNRRGVNPTSAKPNVKNGAKY